MKDSSFAAMDQKPRKKKRTTAGMTLPMGPLLELWDTGTSMSLVAEACGHHRKVLTGWATTGIPIGRADTIASRLGLHPSLIWGDDWWRIARAMAPQ
jgi:hypothetical protein